MVPLYALILAVALGVWSASCVSARADECDDKAAEIVASEGAVVVGSRTEQGGITLKHPLATEVAVECPVGGGIPMDLYLNWDGATPPQSFYEFAGRAGSIVTGAPSPLVRDGARRCQQAALNSHTEFAELKVGAISFECQAFAHGGGGTAITIYRK
jgi:hypothetical protein